MASNSLIHAAPGWAQRELLTPTQINAFDTNQAASINRNNSVSGWRAMSILPMHSDIVGAVVLGGTVGGTSIGNVANTQTFALEGLPNGQVLTGFKVNIIPNVPHVGAPAVLPIVTIYKVALSGGVTALGTATYVWGGTDPGAYDSGFTLSVPAFVETINLNDNRYVWVLTPESGANSQIDTLQSVLCSCTISHAPAGTDLSFWRA